MAGWVKRDERREDRGEEKEEEGKEERKEEERERKRRRRGRGEERRGEERRGEERRGMFRRNMSTSALHGIIRPLLISILIVGCFVTLFFMYYKPSTSWFSGPMETGVSSERLKNNISTNSDKNVTTILLWFWPFGQTFELNVCNAYFGFEGCYITADKNLYNKSDGVVFHHRDIAGDLSNMPTVVRPSVQKWVWFNMESPSHSSRHAGMESLFNLTMNYHLDSDIPLPYLSVIATENVEDFVPPSKNKLVCWIVSNWNQEYARVKFYNEFCKFYLSFENSIHKDYFTEKLYNPLAVGTVPVVLGPPRENYENIIQGDAFIHVEDFASAKELADYLLLLDKNEEIQRDITEIWLRQDLGGDLIQAVVLVSLFCGG
ncbi:Alpha-(1,3)-fucosyltransferase 9 [Takifugu flavidus]|uniref:Fucosyltransferase n=1 Tax=Takifugu flavidus TaxID=433684 RepID=A0A5C6MFN6_9TELE|nr:Alpha-(1,3)-fucosyltransferase 9 [Takifugu flavidus]